MALDLAAGAVFVVVLGVIVRKATRRREPQLPTEPAPVTLLGVVPPPRCATSDSPAEIPPFG